MTSDWKASREAGVPWITRAFARLCLFLGPRVARFLLMPVCGYFYLVRREQREASKTFLRIALGREPTRKDVWRHFWTFSQVVLDRIYLLGRDGKGVELQVEDPSPLAEVVDKGEGCLLLGSHLGSFEASRAIKKERPLVPLRLVMDRTQSPAATAVLESLNPELAAQVLDIGARPGAGLALLSALEDGALIALLGDRVRGEERTVSVNFFGAPASFPVAPHEIAMVTQTPIVLFFGLHVGPGQYRILFERLPPPPKVPRKERARVLSDSVQRYAERLEHEARQAPYNWFNFYDFWGKEK